MLSSRTVCHGSSPDACQSVIKSGMNILELSLPRVRLCLLRGQGEKNGRSCRLPPFRGTSRASCERKSTRDSAKGKSDEGRRADRLPAITSAPRHSAPRTLVALKTKFRDRGVKDTGPGAPWHWSARRSGKKSGWICVLSFKCIA